MAVLELMKKNPHKNIVEFQEVWTESVNRLAIDMVTQWHQHSGYNNNNNNICVYNSF